MSRLDNHNRLSIPPEFRHTILISDHYEMAFCYGGSNKIFLINCKNVTPLDKVIAIRKLDQRGRITMPKTALEILNSNRESFLIISLLDNKICIQGG